MDPAETSDRGRVLTDQLNEAELLIDVDATEAWRRAQALTLDPELGASSHSMAQLHTLCGRLLTIRGEFEEARFEFGIARRIWMLSDQQLRATATAIASFQIQLDIGEYREVVDGAQRFLNRLGATVSALGRSRVRSLFAGLHECLASAFAGLGDFSQAMHHYHRAANLYLALGDASAAARTAIGRGSVLTRQGMPMRSLEVLLRARNDFIKSGSARLQRVCELRIAEAYVEIDRIPAALELLGLVAGQTDAAEGPMMARLQMAQGHAYLRRGWRSDAQDALSAASMGFHRLGMVDALAQAHFASALCALSLDHSALACTEFRAADRLAEHCGNTELRERVWLAQARAVPPGERPSHVRSLIRRTIKSASGARAHDLNLARAHLLAASAAPSDDAAEAELDKAATIAWADGAGRVSLEALEIRARRHRSAGHLEDAEEDLRTILRIVKTMVHVNPDVMVSVDVLETVHRAEIALLQLLLQRDTYRSRIEAWQWQTRLKSQVVGGILKPPAASRWGNELSEEVLASHLVPAYLSGLVDDRAGLVPDWHEDDDVELSASSAPSLDYLMLGDDLVIFVLRDGEVFVRSILGGSHRVLDLARAWQQECSVLSLIPDSARQLEAGGSLLPMGDATTAILRALYDLLVRPVLDLIDDPDVDKLLIVAHRDLNGVPFSALLDSSERPLSAQFRLVQSFASAVLGPSTLSAEVDLAVAGRAALVLAVPDTKAPMVSAEAVTVGRVLRGAEVHIGDGATSSLFLESGQKYGLVHVACHGEFQPEDPLSSTLNFADRALPAREIMNADLRGTRVVLSACASGTSGRDAQEPTGLTWACLVAGASEVVSALWPVQDTVTFQFMECFYSAVAEGMDTSAALSAAQEAIALRYPHPYFWASFQHLVSPRYLAAIGL